MKKERPMNSLTSLLATWLINSLWQTAVITAAGALASRVASKSGPRAQHRIWVTTLVLAVVTPAISFHLPVIAGAHPIATGGIPAEPAPLPRPAATVISGSGILLPQWILYVLVLGYSAILLMSALRKVRSLWWTRILIRDGFSASLSSQQNGIWQDCRKFFGLADARLLHSTRIRGPVTVGVLPPVLLLPENFSTACAAHDFRAAVAHECAHMRRHDFVKNLLCELLSLPLAFHPAVWLIKSRIAQTREMICDDMAAGFTTDSRGYAESLIRLVNLISLAPPASPANAIGIFDANILERRIQRMKTKQQHVSRRMRRLLMSGGAVFLFIVATASSSMAWPVGVQSSAQPAASAADTKPAKTPNLDCTYYPKDTRHYPPDFHGVYPTVGQLGTCERGKQDPSKFFCRSNSDRTQVQEQPACDWKAKRAEAPQQKN
jgi:beta-lactamase regulating signal transducer with metallopeptidase domain